MLAVCSWAYHLTLLSRTFLTCKTSTLPPSLAGVQISWGDGQENCHGHLSGRYEYKAFRVHTSAGAHHQPGPLRKPLIPPLAQRALDQGMRVDH